MSYFLLIFVVIRQLGNYLRIKGHITEQDLFRKSKVFYFTTYISRENISIK